MKDIYASATTAIFAVLALRSFAPSKTVKMMKAKRSIGTYAVIIGTIGYL
jgi:hypothetical protein